MAEHHRSRIHHSTASLIDSMERRTQRTYRYGIGLVCVGATLNWLGFAQGHGYIDPLRYLGVACVISGSFCVCLAMCRWLGRPIAVSSHREDPLGSRNNGDVHVINVAVPMYVPPMHEDYRPAKPPDYDIVAGEPPPYDEAIKLTPGTLFTPSSQYYPSPASPSHSANITCALLSSEVTDHNEKSCTNPNTELTPPPYELPSSQSPPNLVTSNFLCDNPTISTMTTPATTISTTTPTTVNNSTSPLLPPISISTYPPISYPPNNAGLLVSNAATAVVVQPTNVANSVVQSRIPSSTTSTLRQAFFTGTNNSTDSANSNVSIESSSGCIQSPPVSLLTTVYTDQSVGLNIPNGTHNQGAQP